MPLTFWSHCYSFHSFNFRYCPGCHCALRIGAFAFCPMLAFHLLPFACLPMPVQLPASRNLARSPMQANLSFLQAEERTASNCSKAWTALGITGVSFQRYEVTFDQYLNEALPEKLGCSFSVTAVYATTTVFDALAAGQQQLERHRRHPVEQTRSLSMS